MVIRKTFSYTDVGKLVGDCRDLLKAKEIRLHPDSVLGRIFNAADTVAADWADGQRLNDDPQNHIRTGHALRVARAILDVGDDRGLLEALRRMARNDMNLSARNPSQGKDALWEIELLARLRRAGMDARLDEPDIVVDIGFGDYGIACKKVYSQKGVEAHMRKGCRQIESSGGKGVIAINIDDQVPAEHLLSSQDGRSATAFLDQFNREFIATHVDAIERFIMEARCDGVLISSSTLAALPGESSSFNIVAQDTIWAPRHDGRLRLDLLQAELNRQPQRSAEDRTATV